VWVERATGVWAVREIARLIPECPVIVESVVAPGAIDAELEMAAMCFELNASDMLSSSAPASDEARDAAAHNRGLPIREGLSRAQPFQSAMQEASSAAARWPTRLA
jgi:hypothetical protein